MVRHTTLDGTGDLRQARMTVFVLLQFARNCEFALSLREEIPNKIRGPRKLRKLRKLLEVRGQEDKNHHFLICLFTIAPRNPRKVCAICALRDYHIKPQQNKDFLRVFIPAMIHPAESLRDDFARE